MKIKIVGIQFFKNHPKKEKKVKKKKMTHENEKKKKIQVNLILVCGL